LPQKQILVADFRPFNLNGERSGENGFFLKKYPKKIDPDCAFAWHNKGVALMDLGQYEMAHRKSYRY